MTVAKSTKKLKIGLMLPQTEGMRGPGVRRWREVSEMASLAENVGFDSLWVVDHLLYKLEGEDKLLTDDITEDALNSMRFLPGEVTSAIETSLARVYDVDADELAELLFPED